MSIIKIKFNICKSVQTNKELSSTTLERKMGYLFFMYSRKETRTIRKFFKDITKKSKVSDIDHDTEYTKTPPTNRQV
jgi:hypothetical protein